MLEVRPTIKPYRETYRYKITQFKSLSKPEEVSEGFLRVAVEDAWNEENGFKNPLYQYRFLMDPREERQLDELLGSTFDSDNIKSARINAKIPFKVDGANVALYYAQVEVADRPVFSPPEGFLTHSQAVQKGMEKQARFVPRPLDERFGVQAVNYQTGQFWQFEDDQLTSIYKPYFCEEELEERTIVLHKRAFDHTHDETQRDRSGAKKIIDDNVTLYAFNKDNRDLVAVTYFEKDPTFTFGGVLLVEPTYFTDPTYRNLGLSVNTRFAAQRIVGISGEVEIYDKKPILIFTESIRTRSFPMCLQVGCELAGDIDTSINGDLGDAYTYIDDAKPGRGLMAMGLTYTRDRRIS